MTSCIPSLFIRVLGAWIVLQYLALGVWGRITLESVKDLTAVTRECKGRIGGWGEVVGSGSGGEGGEAVIEGGSRGVEWEGGQLVLGGGGGDGDGDDDGIGDGDDIENTIIAALRILCSDLLIELEKPLKSPNSSPEDTSAEAEMDCVKVKKEFDFFLKETTRFLYEIQELQMQWRWGGGSAIKRGLEWLQGLWASRRGNSQNQSFIEQQITLYRETGCFSKLNREVLRKDIEVVEYLNDLIDMFW